ncbi:MAG TPA: hypothetical protein VNL14_09835 [Candidatus Acidoferrales bacterium]|nr:hypothetical protein [Candidatus Acidoferrales bacterium]
MTAKPFLVALFFFGAAAACSAERSATLVNPQTGSTARCDILRGALLDKCIQAAEKRGYVRLEKLTSEQRAELQRRGFLLLDDLTAEQQSAVAGRGGVQKPTASSIP